MKNNKGQATIIIVVLAIAVIVAIAFAFGIPQTAFGGDGDSPSSLCDVPTTSMTFPAVNALNKGTSVSTTVNAKINGGPATGVTSSTTFTVGDDVELLHNASNFLDLKVDSFEVTCGQSQAPTAEIYATSTNSFRLFNTNNQLLTDSATANGTASDTVQASSASPISLDIRIDSTSDESTGDLILVFEADNTTEVDDIVLSGLPGVKKVDVPEFYSAVAAGSIVKAYEVSAVLDGATVQGTLKINPESSQTIGASNTVLYSTAYSKQWFTDTDGAYQYGVEDADGNTKYEDTWDYDVCMGTDCGA